MSIQTIIMGIAFIIQLCRIYFSGNTGDMYTREICIQFLGEIAVILILWVVLIVICGVYFHIINNYKEARPKVPYVVKRDNLLRIAPKFNNDALKEQYNGINLEHRKCQLAHIICLIVLLICAAMGIGYLVNIKHFDSTGNPLAQAKNMGIHLMPWVIIAFLSMIGVVIFEEISAQKTIELLKVVIKNDGRNKVLPLEKNNNKKLIIARSIIAVIALSLIVVGIIDGGASDTLQKAIAICTECIGLG